MSNSEVFKMKLFGRKIKVRILQPHEIIEQGDICSVPIFREQPDSYEETINIFFKNKMNYHMMYTQAIGDQVSDCHTVRIYLRPVNFND